MELAVEDARAGGALAARDGRGAAGAVVGAQAVASGELDQGDVGGPALRVVVGERACGVVAVADVEGEPGGAVGE